MIKLYELFIHQKQPIRDEFSKIKDKSYKSFSLKNLKEDCRNYNVDFYDLAKEIIINKQIAFQCTWCYSLDFSNENPHDQKKHSIIGICKDVKFENPKYHDSDILVKIDNENIWHTLFTNYNNTKTSPDFKVRVYSYIKGSLMEELEIKKDSKKYNI